MISPCVDAVCCPSWYDRDGRALRMDPTRTSLHHPGVDSRGVHPWTSHASLPSDNPRTTAGLPVPQPSTFSTVDCYRTSALWQSDIPFPVLWCAEGTGSCPLPGRCSPDDCMGVDIYQASSFLLYSCLMSFSGMRLACRT